MQTMKASFKMRPLSYVYLTMRLVYCILFGALAGCSHIDEETPRSFVRLVSADTIDLRNEISTTLEKNSGSLHGISRPLVLSNNQGLKVAPIDFGWVTEQGAILAYNKKLSVIVLLEPVISDGKVSWSCVVHPDDAKPKECGSWK